MTPRRAIATTLAAWLLCVAAYPHLRGAALFTAYEAWRWAAALAIAYALASLRRLPRAREWPAVLLATGAALQVVAGPWIWPDVRGEWSAARVLSCITYASVIGAIGVDAWRERRRS